MKVKHINTSGNKLGIEIDGQLYEGKRGRAEVGDAIMVRTMGEDEWFGIVCKSGPRRCVAEFDDYAGSAGKFYMPLDYTLGSYPISMGTEAVLLTPKGPKAKPAPQVMADLLVVKGKGFSKKNLRQAFNMVKSANWKQPINKVVVHPGDDNLRCAVAAITYFTGSMPTVTPMHGGRAVRITAAGYFATMGV